MRVIFDQQEAITVSTESFHIDDRKSHGKAIVAYSKTDMIVDVVPIKQ
jgi:hypothetical protein